MTSFLLELLVYPAIYYLWRKEVTEGPASLTPGEPEVRGVLPHLAAAAASTAEA